MEILEVDPFFFDKSFPNKTHVFNGANFNILNKTKVDEIKYLIFSKKGKNILGLIGGISKNKFNSPFSAPFGGWSYDKTINLPDLEEAHGLAEKYLVERNINHIKIILPPLFYDEEGLSQISNTAFRYSYVVTNVDLNFQLALENFNSDYLATISYNANKNYRIADRSGLTIERASTLEGIRTVYTIIAQNRSERGFPLKMTFEDVINTIKIIRADFFIVFNKESLPIAGAMVFHVTKEIVQVVYWGHLVEFSSLKPINYLSYHLFDYYKKEGLRYVDIGPSTENSKPNYGLIEFKQSIGCNVSLKFTFEKELTDERHK